MSNDANLGPRPTAARPHFPKDYGIRKAQDGSGLLPWSHACEHLAASRNYWIHTTRVDGRPHVKPVWGLWFEQRFYFSTSPKSVTARNLAVSPSLIVHLESGNEVVMLEGITEQVTDDSLLSRLDESYSAKYAYHILGNKPGGLVYLLKHKVAFAWIEHDYVGSATRYAFE